jgi:hypothetical protein
MLPGRKLAIVSLCAGAGFAIVAALATGAYFWYESRLVPPSLSGAGFAHSAVIPFISNHRPPAAVTS